MGVVGVRIKVDGKIVKQGLQDLSAEIPKIGRNQIYKAMVRARSRLRKKAAKRTYPIPWDNIRQKIKVIILLKTFGNFPYKRSGAYQAGFVLVKTDDGYALVNTNDMASYIGGDEEGLGQSRIHRGRYPLIRNVINEEIEKLPSAVVQHIEMVAQQKGFGT